MRRNRKWIKRLKKKKRRITRNVLVFGLYDVCNGRQWDRGKWTLRLSRFHAMVAPDDYYSVGGGSFQLSRAEWRLNWHCLYDHLRCLLATVLYCVRVYQRMITGRKLSLKLSKVVNFHPHFPVIELKTRITNLFHCDQIVIHLQSGEKRCKIIIMVRNKRVTFY